MNPPRLELLPEDTALLIIDFQERLCAAMPAERVAEGARNVARLLTLAGRLDLAVVATEQYPKGLGPTLTEVKAASATLAPHAKTAFSALRDPAAAAALRATGRRTVVVTGMETHICVYQTVRDLLSAGYAVHVPVDAVVSRTAANWQVGLDLCRAAGAVLTSTETVLFDLVKVGQGDVFKEVSRLVK